MKPGRPFKVLIVDDEPEILECIRDMLIDKKDIEIFTTASAEEGISLLPHVDAVLADCVFPQVEEFNETVKRLGKPIIRMSGKVRRATNLEIPKPFSAKQVRSSIEMLRFFHNPISIDQSQKIAA